jgi:hypothetical protein
MWTLLRDGKEVFKGKEIECFRYIHTRHCYSLSHAIHYEGYILLNPKGKC